ncbi:unnamed protein product [Camellia sinensis]
MSNNDSNLTMATFNLPFDVTIDIFSRLPVKSLFRFTSVCKSWYALIKTPNFISKHLTHFTLNPNFPFTSLLVSTKSKGYGMSLFFNDEFDRPIDLDFPFLTQESDPDIVGICNGLVCISVSQFGKPLFLCNPATKQFRRIPGYRWWDERGAKLKRVTFGFGFHPSAKDYKLVRIAYYSCFDARVVVRAEFFSVRTGNWREIDAGKARFFGEEVGAVMPYEICGSVNGVFYWAALVLPLNTVIIVSFDMDDEVFAKIATPPCFSEIWDQCNWKLTELNNKLALIIYPDDYYTCFDVWVLDENRSSWTKQFKVGPFPDIGSRVGGEKNVEIMLVGCAKDGKLIVEDRSESDVLKLFSYDPKSQVTKNLPAAHVVYPYEVYLYKESLLPVGNIEAIAQTHVCCIHDCNSVVDYGVVRILISYLEKNWKKVNLAKVASVINVKDGISAVMMIVLAHISDTWTGRFVMVVCSTAAYAIGFWVLYVSAMFNSANNVVLCFYLAMVPIAAGRAMRGPTLYAFLGDQIGHQDEPNQDKKRVQARVKFWVRLNKFLGATVAFFVFGPLLWKESFEISAIAMTISGFLFSCGFPFYYRKKPTGSPITDVYYVIKAAIWKRNLDYPATPKQFYHNDKGELELSPHVALLRWLDKAAIEETSNSSMSSPEEQESRGMLCPAAQVTKVKLLLTMAPMWATFFNYCLVVATGILRLCTERQQKHAWKVRIGVGMLKLYKDNIGEKIIPMSVFWLTPQFCLLGFMEGLCEDGLVDFYCQQVPESMKAYGPPFNRWVLGMGNFVSILWVLTFKPWFGDNINDSQLDNYYAILAIVSIANLFVYGLVSNMPIYNIDQVAEKDVQLQEILADGNKSPVSKSFIPPSHLSIATSTQRITASTSFPEHQSRNTGIVVQKKLSHQKTM